MPTRAAVLDSHLAALESAETRAVREIAGVYNQARRELIARLVDGWTADKLVTPEEAARFLRQSGLLDQIDARMAQLEREVSARLRGIVNSRSEAGLAQVRRELALLPPSIRDSFTGTFDQINTRMVERHLYPAQDGVRLATASTALTLRRELAVGVVQGEAFPTLVRRLMAATPTGEGPAVWANGQLSTERMVRRTVITAENSAKVEAISEVRKQIPEVQKQAIAVIGQGTTDCCLRVHGQIKPTDMPFDLAGEPRFADHLMAPAFHWNCRTSVAMYHPAFEASTPTATMREEAKGEIARRKEEKATRREKADARAAARAEAARLAPDDEPVTIEADTPPAGTLIPSPEAVRQFEEARRQAEVALAEVADEVRGLQYTAPDSQIISATASAKGIINRFAESRYGVTPAEMERVVDETFKKLVADHPVAIQFPSVYIESLLADGRFKTQFETASSGGTLTTRLRSQAEEFGLGIPTNIDIKERPVYGFIDLGLASRFNVLNYGDLTFIAKDEVKQRATVTADDSLGNMLKGDVAGTPLTSPGKEAWDHAPTAIYEYAQSGKLSDLTFGFAYIEVQMQRGVTLDDMRAVVDVRRELTEEQKQALTQRGIEVLYE